MRKDTPDRQKAAAFIVRPQPAIAESAAAVAARAQREEEDNARRRAEEAVAGNKIGTRMPDGTVYAGLSPETKKPLFALPADAELKKSFNGAAQYAQQLNEEKACGHDDWRVPTAKELDVLFNGRAAVGGFCPSGRFPDSYYWSSTPYNGIYAWGQQFRDGGRDYFLRDVNLAVRCVRG